MATQYNPEDGRAAAAAKRWATVGSGIMTAAELDRMSNAQQQQQQQFGGRGLYLAPKGSPAPLQYPQPSPPPPQQQQMPPQQQQQMPQQQQQMPQQAPPKSEAPKRAREESAADRTRVLGSGPAAKAPRQFVRDKDGAIKVGDISDNGKRKVQVKKWSNRVLVDVREYYEKDGAMLPGKKGISLTVDQWKELLKMQGAIADAIKQIES